MILISQSNNLEKSSRYHILFALDSYVKAFQYIVINSILYTNSKLCKIEFRMNDACTFCNDEPENLYHLFCECPHSKTFLTDFESYWCHLSDQPIHLSAQNVLFGVLSKQCSIKFIKLFHSNWKILLVGQEKKPNTS